MSEADWSFVEDPHIMAVVKAAVRYHGRRFAGVRDGSEDVELHPDDVEQDILMYLAVHPKLVASIQQQEVPRGWYGRQVYDRAVRRSSIKAAQQRLERSQTPAEEELAELPLPDFEPPQGPYSALRVRRLVALAVDAELLDSWRDPWLDAPKDLNGDRKAKRDPAHGGTAVVEMADMRRAWRPGGPNRALLTLRQQQVLVCRYVLDLTRAATCRRLDLTISQVSIAESNALARLVHYLNTGQMPPVPYEMRRRKPHWVG